VQQKYFTIYSHIHS